ncbi:hypothetical protein [Natrinema altunense]|uniref:Uncharacterized protein n=1 Tax=Natrinema altunense TaxID=222984 RepID=A0A482XXW2_9EURY|nr:hypothetical protein [Natrinema altunense]RZH68758.1 hypothetical protein ELS17_04660 [Natrinema altunense]
MEDDIEIQLEIVKRNLNDLKAAEQEDERLRAIQNLLASVNTLTTRSYQLAREDVEGSEWVAEQQRGQLNDLLAS